MQGDNGNSSLGILHGNSQIHFQKTHYQKELGVDFLKDFLKNGAEFSISVNISPLVFFARELLKVWSFS